MTLELRDICKSFGEKQVLKGVSFSAESGEAFGLLGRNGAGKTTAIRILMDVFPAESGQVLLDGAPIDYGATRIGYLPEERGLYPKKKIMEQLVYFARLKGMEKAEAVSAVERWLDRLGMSEYRDRRLDTLSKGNQQKIQLITALSHDPQIVVLDEPFSGLDPVNAQILKDVVREELQRGKIVLFSSHQMSYIEEFCDRIAILRDGEVAVKGGLRELKGSYVRDRLIVRSRDADLICRERKHCEKLANGDVMVRILYAGEKGEVMRKLIYQYDIDEIRVYEPSLQDIFVEYAGDQPSGDRERGKEAAE